MLSPLLAGIWVAIRITMGGPVLFRQERPGWKGRSFILHKFRTMTNACHENGELLPNEQRMTRLGGFLRSSSLDELPELWDVLRGKLSIVGPRPLLVRYLPRYSPEQARRHDIKPGITGWAQVNGRNAISWEDKLRLDVWYVDNVSFVLDCRILFETVRTIVKRDGIDEPGFISASEFMGSGPDAPHDRPA
jgi:lipopolysaccharide/colanic/teichoic acid biosynthesis glycosyltransferase